MIPRARLFELVDDARNKPVVWIAAPAGAGKTTLVASYLQARKFTQIWYRIDDGDNDIASFFYFLSIAANRVAPQQCKSLPVLTPEYRAGLRAFARNYFRTLIRGLPRPVMLVLDNYQDVLPDAPLHEALSDGLLEIVDGVTVVILSRYEPPPPVARLRASGSIAFLSSADLLLTKAETCAIARSRLGARHLSDRAVELLHDRTRGWVAGLILMTEPHSFALESWETDSPRTREPPAQEVFDHQAVFDYFAHEMFRHADPAMQDFLLKTAFLPRITAAAAANLAAVPNAEHVLESLAKRNYFTVRHAGAECSFEYHPLFRAFLHNIARRQLTSEELEDLLHRSAGLLASRGQVEAAVQLLLETGDWHDIARLILANAASLVAHGRFQTLSGWLQRLPPSFRGSDPWLLFWWGVCRLSSDPAEACAHFEKALSAFQNGNDSVPIYRCWAGIVDSFVAEGNDYSGLDPWLDSFHSLQGSRGAAPDDVQALALFSYVDGLFHRRSDDPDLAVRVRHLESFLLRAADPAPWLRQACSLIYYCLWIGDLSRGEHLLQTLLTASSSDRPNDAINIMGWLLQSLHACQMRPPKECIRFAEQGLARAESCGIRVFDHLLLGRCVYGHLLDGNVAAAQAAAGRMASQSGRAQLHDALFHQLLSVIAVREGNNARAAWESRRSVERARASGWLFAEAIAVIVAAWVNAMVGKTASALREVRRACELGCRMRSPMIAYYCAFTEATIWSRKRSEHNALEALRRALDIGEQMGGMNPPWYLRYEAASLYQLALEAGLHEAYVRTVITRLQLPAPPKLLTDRWPHRVHLYTLGRFSVTRDGIPITFRGKAQKRPLDLLRALLAQGERGATSRGLMEILWPESDGHAAHRALNITLHRLRKLIGVEQCILMHEGRLRINSSLCWVDAWALATLLADSNGRGVTHERAVRLLSLYEGPFLPEEDSSWVLPVRERLRSRFLQTAALHAEQLERDSQWEAAIEWCEKILELDPLAEDAYRRQMMSYYKLGRWAAALAAYRRCERILSSHLRVRPAPETRALCQTILRTLLPVAPESRD